MPFSIVYPDLQSIQPEAPEPSQVKHELSQFWHEFPESLYDPDLQSTQSVPKGPSQLLQELSQL